MGVNFSAPRTVQEVVNKVVNESFVENSQTCDLKDGATQIFSLRGIKTENCSGVTINNVSQNMSSNLDFSCVQSNLTTTDFKTSLESKLNQALDREFSDFPLGNTTDKAETINSVSSTVTNRITTTNDQSS